MILYFNGDLNEVYNSVQLNGIGGGVFVLPFFGEPDEDTNAFRPFWAQAHNIIINSVIK